MKFRSMAVSFGLLTMVGCQNIFEDNDVTLDGSKPYNTIASPGANHVYKTSDAIKLETSFVDKDQVAEIDVRIVSLASDLRSSQDVVTFKRFPNASQVKLDTAFAPNTFGAGKYQLLIRAVDTRKNEGVEEIMFTVN